MDGKGLDCFLRCRGESVDGKGIGLKRLDGID